MTFEHKKKVVIACMLLIVPVYKVHVSVLIFKFLVSIILGVQWVLYVGNYVYCRWDSTLITLYENKISFVIIFTSLIAIICNISAFSRTVSSGNWKGCDQHPPELYTLAVQFFKDNEIQTNGTGLNGIPYPIFDIYNKTIHEKIDDFNENIYIPAHIAYMESNSKYNPYDVKDNVLQAIKFVVMLYIIPVVVKLLDLSDNRKESDKYSYFEAITEASSYLHTAYINAQNRERTREREITMIKWNHIKDCSIEYQVEDSIRFPRWTRNNLRVFGLSWF